MDAKTIRARIPLIAGLLFVSTTAVGSIFSKSGSTDAPPQVPSAATFPEQTSTVIVPITSKLAALRAKLETVVPGRVASIDQYIDGCAKKKVFMKDVSIGCHVGGYLDRGAIEISGAGNQVTLSVPLQATVQVKGRGEIGKNIKDTVKGSPVVTFTVSVDVSEDWQPVVKVDVSHRWNKAPYLYVLGARITVENLADAQIQKLVPKLTEAINDWVAKLDLRGKAEINWKRAFTVVSLTKNPDVWVRFAPTAVGFSPLEVSNDSVQTRLMVSGVSESFVGKTPSSPVPTALPRLSKVLPPGHVEVAFPIFVDYKVAQKEIADGLKLNERQTVQVPVLGAVPVTITNVSVYSTAGNEIAIGLSLDAERPGDFLHTIGTIWFTGKLKFDNSKKELVPAPEFPFDYRGHTDNAATNFLLSIVRVPIIREKIADSLLRLDLSKQFETAIAQATKALNGTIAPGVVSHASKMAAEVPRIIEASTDGLYVDLLVSGDITLEIVSPP